MPKQLNQIIGSFVFRNEGDGCLSSKYHNGDSPNSPFIEGCKITSPPSLLSPYLGTFRTIWLDERTFVPANLTISRHRTNANLFELFWNNLETNRLIFEGTGMLFNDLLVGTYWD